MQFMLPGAPDPSSGVFVGGRQWELAADVSIRRARCCARGLSGLSLKERGLNMRMHNPPHPGSVLRDYLGSTPVTNVARHLGITRATLSRVLNGAAGFPCDGATPGRRAGHQSRIMDRNAGSVRSMAGFAASPPENRAPASFQLLASITRLDGSSKDITGRRRPELRTAIDSDAISHPLSPQSLPEARNILCGCALCTSCSATQYRCCGTYRR